jgi:hypothetical protein
VIYRETGETDFYEEHLRDIVLKQQSTIGPWVVTGLGVTLVLFLSYLVYSNLRLPSADPLWSERSLRKLAESAPARTVFLPEHVRTLPRRPSGPAMTSVPQSRATNALLGGEGPALLPGRIAVTAHDTMHLGPSATAISH